MIGLATGGVVAFVVLDLVIIVVVARLVGSTFVQMGQPRVVGEIVAGILLGPTLLGPALWGDFTAPEWLRCADSLATAPAGTIQSPTWCLFPAQARSVIGAIGQFALLLFMFLTGLEVDQMLLRGRMRAVAVVGAGVVAIPILVGFVIGPLMANETFKPPSSSTIGFTLFLGAILAVTAFPVTVRILQERGMTTTVMGATSIAAAAVCTVVMFLVASMASSLARVEPASWLAAKMALSIAYLAAMVLIVRPLLERIGGSAQDSRRGNTPLLIVAALIMFGSGYVAHSLGLSVIVGGFVAGAIMPSGEQLRAAIGARIAAFTGSILLPVFLASSGLETDFTALTFAATGGLALFLVAGIVSKWAGGAVLARAAGLSWAEGNVLGVLMNCRGLLVLVVALEGVQAGVITPLAQIGAVVMALVTTAMTGPLLNAFTRAPASGHAQLDQPSPQEA